MSRPAASAGLYTPPPQQMTASSDTTHSYNNNNNTGADILQCTGAVQCRVYCRYCAVQDILQKAEAQRTANCEGCMHRTAFIHWIL